jgi:hypothetical protein
MKIAIIESVASSPHIETAGEIALSLKKYNDVSFFWAGYNLPWNDWELPFYLKLLGGSYNNKIKKFKKILSNQGIVIDEPILNVDYDRIFRWSNSFNGNLKSLKKYKYDNSYLGAGAASSIISYFKNEKVDIEKYNKEIKNLLLSSAIVYERTKKYLKKNKIDKIYTFNNRFATCYPIICAANSLKIKTIRHERGSKKNRYELYDKDVHDLELTKKNFDFYWKKNKNKNKLSSSKKFFYDKLKGINTNDTLSKSYISSQIKDHLPKLPKNKRIVTFFTSRDYEKASIVDMEFDQIKIFKKFKKIVSNFKDIHLVIRVHPSLSKYKSYDDEEWMSFSNKNTTVIQSYEKHDTYSLLFRSDIVVTYTSSIIVESAYFGIPSISLGEFWWTGLKIAEEPKNFNNLNKMLSGKYKFRKSNKLNCMKIANYFLNYGIKFKYYSPKTFTRGKFLNEYISWKPYYIILLEKSGFINLIKKIISYI